ncbi:MAG: plasmid partition protein ParG [Chloroflexi bacterium]|nr:plasmid partition protein ParG [Chloroflexota bacterium]
MRARDEGKTKRLNAEIPAALHARVKSRCALEGRDMTQVVIELLEKRFPAEGD